MNNFFNKYPYTDFHELNLDWLLSEIKKLSEKVDELSVSTPEVKALLESMQKQITKLELDYDKLDQITINKNNIEHLDSEYATTVNDLDSLKIKVEILEELLKNYDTEINSKFDAKMATIQNSIYATIFVIEDEIDKINDIIHAKYANDVYNYVLNKRVSLDRNNTELYNNLENSISAMEYDSLNLTADDYKKFDINAIDYLRDSKKLLHYYYVYMPISGYKQEISNSLTEIYNDLKGTMDNDQYNSLDLTADDYKNLNLTNTEYRSYNPFKTSGYVNINGSGLTTAQYSKLGIE